MPQFQPDVTLFGDLAGYGAWDIGHGREHIQFVRALAALTPPIVIQDFDLLSLLTAGQARRSMIQSHAATHALLRAATGVQGADLSVVDLDNNGSFDDWMGTHASEHDRIRTALGMT